MNQRIRHFIYFILLAAFDQLVKFWVIANLKNNDPIDIIPDVFSLQYHQNSGAVWGIMSGKVTFLIIFTLIVLSFIIYLYLKIPEGKKYNALKMIMVFITAGAIGNLIDRIYLGYVVDFIYFELINFPLFNIADCYLTVSSVILLILALFYYKDEDFKFLDQLFHRNKKKQEKNSDQ